MKTKDFIQEVGRKYSMTVNCGLSLCGGLYCLDCVVKDCPFAYFGLLVDIL